MGNKLAVYKDQSILDEVDKWWQRAGFHVAPFEDLYQSYYEYTVLPVRANSRLSADQFAKCLMAIRVLEIDGRWKQVAEWQPTPDQIRRVTA